MRSATPRRVTVTVRLRSDNGLSTVTWDDVTLANPAVRTSDLSIRLSWTFELPLVAVDPAAEAQLHEDLDSAVASGSYLPATATAPSQPVPMLMAGSIASDETAQVTVDPQGAAGMAPRRGDADHGERLPGSSCADAGNSRPGRSRPTGRLGR